MFRDRYTINGNLSETRVLRETLWRNRSYAHAPMLRLLATEMGQPMGLAVLPRTVCVVDEEPVE